MPLTVTVQNTFQILTDTCLDLVIYLFLLKNKIFSRDHPPPNPFTDTKVADKSASLITSNISVEYFILYFSVLGLLSIYSFYNFIF